MSLVSRLKRFLLAAIISAVASFLATGCATPPVEPGVTLAVAQVDRGVMVWLPDSVMFEFGKSSLNHGEAAPYLDRVARLLRDKSAADVLLEGHTDNVGSEAFNQPLSERRANAVRDALLERGVATARVRAAGLGFSRPLAPNDTETGRRLNRRVEIILLGEKLENLTRGEPANAFEQAFDRVKRVLEETRPKG